MYRFHDDCWPFSGNAHVLSSEHLRRLLEAEEILSSGGRCSLFGLSTYAVPRCKDIGLRSRKLWLVAISDTMPMSAL